MYQTFDGDGNGKKARRQSLLPIESSDFEVIRRLRQRRDGGGATAAARRRRRRHFFLKSTGLSSVFSIL